MTNQNQIEQRDLGIDLGRLVGCYFIILLHQTSNQYGNMGWVSDVLDQVARWAVPFFFIISGYLLPHHKLWKETVYKYARRLLPIFVFWCFFYVILEPEPSLHLSSAKQVLKMIVTGGPGYHLWFLPSLGLCVLIAAPFLQFGRVGLLFFLGVILFVIGLIIGPYQSFICAGPLDCILFNPRNGPFLGLLFVGLGALIKSGKLNPTRTLALFLMLFGALLSTVELYRLFVAFDVHLTKPDFVLGTVPLSLGAAFLFLTINIENQILAGVCRTFGSASLGIYAVHILILRELNNLLDPSSLFSGVTVSILTLCISAVIAAYAARTPFIQHVFR